MTEPMVQAERLRSRFKAVMLGAAVGDALGASFEGHPKVDAHELREYARMPGELRYTDDTHMSIGVAESLLACSGFDGEHMVRMLAENYRREPWRGYGQGPPLLFDMIDEGVPWQRASQSLFDGRGSFGNGAAMRIAPVALFAHPNVGEAVRLAAQTAAVTRVPHAQATHERTQPGLKLVASVPACCFSSQSSFPARN